MAKAVSIAILPDMLRKKLQVSPCPDKRLGPCWLWTGPIRKGSLARGGGYVYIHFKGKGEYLHRLIYRTLVGRLVKGKQIDHLCKVRHCANPNHLEQVTQLENIKRGSWYIGKNARKTHCPKGHSLRNARFRTRVNSVSGSYIQRECRVCDGARSRHYYRSHLEECRRRNRERYYKNRKASVNARTGLEFKRTRI
jgi:hypothetical protein